MLAVNGHGNTSCSGKLIDHYRVLVNDALCFDDFIMQRWVGVAAGFHAELVKILVVVLQHEGQILDVEVVAG
jgi:hypothetical protein